MSRYKENKISHYFGQLWNIEGQNPFDLDTKTISSSGTGGLLLATSTEEIVFYHYSLSLQSAIFIES